MKYKDILILLLTCARLVSADHIYHPHFFKEYGDALFSGFCTQQIANSYVLYILYNLKMYFILLSYILM